MQTSKAIQDQIRDRMSKKYNLSITEFSVLEVLYHKDKQTIKQITDKVLISSGSMTYVIDKLEQRGLIVRVPCPSDRRVIHVNLTIEGNDLMNEIMPKHVEMVDYIFGLLKDEEAEYMVELLNRVNIRTNSPDLQNI